MSWFRLGLASRMTGKSLAPRMPKKTLKTLAM